MNILVGIDAALDTATGIVTWKFTTLDPATHEFPEDPEDGFLPPNVTSPEGEGEMLFTVSLKPGFGLGTTVCNDASIVFDFNPPIVTPTSATRSATPEDCENCVDDDGDTLVDRADPDCTATRERRRAPASATPRSARPSTSARRRSARSATKLASNRLKQLGACEKAVADCVQLKPGDAACLAKAQAKCTKARTALPTAEAKLTAAIAKACGEPTVTAANLARGGRPRLRRRDERVRRARGRRTRAPSPTSPSASASNISAPPSASSAPRCRGRASCSCSAGSIP